MKKLIFVFSFLIFVFSLPAYAAKVMKVKDKKVYMMFEPDEPFTTGDYFLISNAEGKKIGLVQIKKIKGLKAIALLKKGKAEKGLSASFKSASKKKQQEVAEDENSEPEEPSGPDRTRLGVLVGYGMAQQDVNQYPNGTSAQDGTSFAVRGVYDYPLLDRVYFRGMGGAELFSVSGQGYPITSSSIPSTVKTSITYLALDGLLHWSMYKGRSSRFYFVGGLAILYPLSKSSDTIYEDSIDSLTIGEFGAGFEFGMGGYSIPLELSYYYFPSGDDVSTNVISFKVGVMF